MSVNYNDLITVEEKRSILQQRITQFATEAYQHDLNKQTCEKVEDQAGVENAEKALNVLKAAIEIHQAELKSLPEPAVE